MSMRKIYIAMIIALLGACATVESDESYESEITLRGEMLFEGSNTLQAEAVLDKKAIAEHLGADPQSISEVKLLEATVEMDEEQLAITESFLLQIVSDNKGLKSLASLSPLDANSSSQKLGVSEKAELWPHLQDNGSTWVLDLNLTEDLMDDMQVRAKLRFLISYKP